MTGTEALTAFEFLADLPEPLRERLAEALRGREARSGEVLLREGDAGADLLFLVTGEVEATRRVGEAEAVLARIRAGVPLGELQALIGGPRTASVRAVTDCALLELPGEVFAALAEEHPVLVERLAVYARRRLRRSQLLATLQTRYGSIDAEAFAALESAVEWIELAGGEVLVREGEASDAMFFLVQGALVVTREGAGGAIGELFPGESFGETALLPRQTRMATVRATRASVVGRVQQRALLAIVERHPAVLRRFLEVMVERQQVDPLAIRGRRVARTIALVPLGPEPEIRGFHDRLAAALAGAGTAIRIGSEAVRERFGAAQLDEGAGEGSLAFRLEYWLEVLRAEHDVVILEGDALESAWTRRCVEGATEVVLVGVAGGDPAVRGRERALLGGAAGQGPRTTLVLLSGPGGGSAVAGRWLAGRAIDTTLHVRVGRAEDEARVARFLTGRAVGLVLSGGGARSFAGIGVLRALYEAGVAVDAVGGVSAGALIAALVAEGLSPAAIHERLSQFLWSTRLGLGLAVASLFPVHPLERAVRRLFGGVRIEDLALPACFVSVNLTRARQRVSTRGELCAELLATNAMPGMFPPVVIDGDLHVDGALLNNVPIAEVKALVRGGPVIAIDVTPSVEFAENPASGTTLAGLDVVRAIRRQGDEGTQAPHLVNLLLRSQLLHHVTVMRELRQQADLYLQPEVSQYSFFQYFRHREIAEAAYQQTRAAVRAWREAAG